VGRGGRPSAVLLPVFARVVGGGAARTRGLLMSRAGGGALAGALYLASRTTVRGLGRVIALALTVLGIALIALALSRSVPLSCGILFLTGFSVITFTASINTILQTITDEDKRGRVVSLYVTAFMGMGTFGTLAGGAVADRLGAPGAVALGGIAVLIAAAWFARLLPEMRRQIRPVYVRLGIIPEMAEGIQTATELRPKA
jgi:predicted MFS family arabinose efflux permease